jgi:hypothetical protein
VGRVVVVAEVEPHVRATLEMVRDRVTFPVGLSVAPDGTEAPYLVAHPDPGDVEAARLCGRRSRITVYTIWHAVGSGPEQALWVADRARVALLGDPPVLTGRKVYRLVQEGSEPVRRDNTVQPPLYLAVFETGMFSDPA